MHAPPIPPWKEDWSESRWDAALNARLESLDFDVIVDTPRPAAENMAIDEALLYRVALGIRRPLLRLWDWSEAAVVLGSYQSVSDEFDAMYAASAGFRFVRRISGGGAMVVEPGRTITWSLIVPETIVQDLSYVQSFAYLDSWCVRALRAIGVPASYKPINDLVSPAGKMAGAAQCRRRGTVLHHAAMAWRLDNTTMRHLLRHGVPRISTKSIASAEKHVSPLSDFTTLTRADVMAHLAASFRAIFRTETSSITAGDLADASTRRKQLASHEWLYRVP